jgi:type IV secretory pathway protease TraF
MFASQLTAAGRVRHANEIDQDECSCVTLCSAVDCPYIDPSRVILLSRTSSSSFDW